ADITLTNHEGVAHGRQFHFVALDVKGDRTGDAGALDGDLDRVALFAAHGIHHLLGRPLFGVLLVDGEDGVAIAQAGPPARPIGSDRQNVNAVIAFRDGYADAVSAAALLG